MLWARFGSPAGGGITNAYDGLGRMTGQTDSVHGAVVGYGYNQANARTMLIYPDGHYVASQLDAANRMIYLGFDLNYGLLAQAYDDLGNRNWLGQGAAITRTYSHDGLGRLTAMTNDLAAGSTADATWSFSYTPSGQLASSSASTTLYDYKEANNTTDAHTFNGLNQDAAIAAVGGGYDANGNLSNDGSRLFYYDAYNRLIGIGTTAYPSNPPYMTFSYDPLGRLASQTYYSTTTQFLYDGADLIGEYDGSGNLLERYIHGTGVDEPLVWLHGSGTGDVRFFAQDYHGSVIGYTDYAGNLSDYYRYDPYGVPYESSNSTPWTGSARFGYTGQMVLPEVKLDNYKARIYDPIMGRFLQTDPIGSGDDLDLYAYTAGDPVNGADPTGLYFEEDATETTAASNPNCALTDNTCTPVTTIRLCGIFCKNAQLMEQMAAAQYQKSVPMLIQGPEITLIAKTNDWNNDEVWDKDEADEAEKKDERICRMLTGKAASGCWSKVLKRDYARRHGQGVPDLDFYPNTPCNVGGFHGCGDIGGYIHPGKVPGRIPMPAPGGEELPEGLPITP